MGWGLSMSGCVGDSCVHVVFIAPLLKVLVWLNGGVCFSVYRAGVIKGSSVVQRCMGRGAAADC